MGFSRMHVIWMLVGFLILDLVIVGIPLGALFMLLAVIFRYKPLTEFLNAGIDGE